MHCLKFYLLFFFCLFAFIIVAQEDTTIYLIVEEMPRFSGCEQLEELRQKKSCADQKLLRYLHSHLTYPLINWDTFPPNELFVVTFIVTSKGLLQNFEVLKSIHPLIDNNILSLFKNMPPWVSGKRKQVPVNVRMKLPIRIRLAP